MARMKKIVVLRELLEQEKKVAGTEMNDCVVIQDFKAAAIHKRHLDAVVAMLDVIDINKNFTQKGLPLNVKL